MPKISPDDPALIALNKIAEALGPHSREEQLRILASVCVQLDKIEHARVFLDALERERNPRPRKPPPDPPAELEYDRRQREAREARG